MTLLLHHAGQRYQADPSAARSIAIPLDFDGPQPNFFAAPRSDRQPLRLGDFVGRTKLGGSCNVDMVRLVPHCNGTHTETISHIVNEDIWVGHRVGDVLSLAVLISVPIVPAARTDETYRPQLEPGDRLVTARELDAAWANHAAVRPAALIVRTQPNRIAKRTQAYTAEAAPAFFTVEAMQWINQLKCRHLLVDLPSIDRMHDEGLLTNHHLFWNVKEGTRVLSGECWQDKTITEMIFVPDDVTDGRYLLNMQVPPFCSDAAPSRPMILPATPLD